MEAVDAVAQPDVGAPPSASASLYGHYHPTFTHQFFEDEQVSVSGVRVECGGPPYVWIRARVPFTKTS